MDKPIRSMLGLQELTGRDLGPLVECEHLGFHTTEELSTLDFVIGQPRALRALNTGIGIRQPGYHVYVAGQTGTGRMSMVLQVLRARAASEAVPDDWVYVNNFDSTDNPVAIALKAGDGARLRQDMSNLVGRLLDELPKAFQREDFMREIEQLRKQYREQSEQTFDELRRMAHERELFVQQVDDGRFAFIPLRNGKPISSEEAAQLSAEELKQIDKHQEEVMSSARSVFQRQQEIERQMSVSVRQVERTFADQLITPLLDEIAIRYKNEKLTTWLARLKAHFLLNLDRFRRRAGRIIQQLEPIGESALGDIQERFSEYQVNLLVDNGALKEAPVVVEAAPNYRNLFGTIERVVDRYGRVVTNFTRIKGGSLLRANGGYLVFDMLDALAEPLVWRELKRTLKRGSAELEIYDPFALFTVSGMKPEPIPLNIKLVVVGDPLLYHLLYRYDDEFQEIFKFKADFDTEIGADSGAAQMYGQLIEKLRKGETKIPPFDCSAVATLVRASARLAEHKEKLTAQFSRLCDLIREAALWAEQENSSVVSAKHVQRAIDEQVYRSDLIAAKIRELIQDGTLLLELTERSVGQVNGLAAADLGDYVFGWPTRITASVGIGSEGIVNIEHESHLSGSTFDKGLLILEGYLRNTYAREHSVSISAGLAMEQSYGGVDGDSASVAELLCLLSAISNIPLRQDVAVTGSINQWGQIQPIGAVNEKVEGFFDVCREAGLTGHQGVCIPKANVKNLVLRQDVIDAVEQEQFHIWAIDHIDQGIGLLSELPAGDIHDPDSFHGRVDKRIREMDERLKPDRAVPTIREMTLAPGMPEAPRDPRPPLPGRT